MTTTPLELPREIDVQSVKQLIERGEEFLFIDCREPDEHDFCRIEGTRLLPIKQVSEWLPNLAGQFEQRMVVHCHAGKRSARLVDMLRQAGFLRAQSMIGGINAWSEKIDPRIPIY